MDRICIYLRKSRADEELEKSIGEHETLSKHKKALLKFAKDKNLNIVEIKEEIVSGESLFFRPKMLELLKEVEDKTYTGVLVMDMQRLGRGDMKEQGVILETFKNSNTKIITPVKTYDLNNDFDEDFSEFEAFMSRKELKMINRRMQGGRVRSVQDGNYIATHAPFGYDIGYIGRNRILVINNNEANIVKLIFNLYIDGNGASSISNKLNALGHKTKFNNNFSSSSILFILKNPIYIGKITWKKKDIKKSKLPGKVKDTKTRSKDEWIISNGKHEPIIDMDTWSKAQEILSNKYHIPYQLTNAPVNPLAGLITCKVCGKKMTMRKLRGISRLLCTNKCGNKSVRFDYFEKKLLNSLERYLKEYEFNIKTSQKSDSIDLYKNQLNNFNKELTTLNNQKLKLFDLLEREIYSEELFLQRSKDIDSRISLITSEISKINDIINRENLIDHEHNLILLRNVLEGYKLSDDVKDKNELLKSILFKIDYIKKPTEKDDNFEIQLFPKLSK